MKINVNREARNCTEIRLNSEKSHNYMNGISILVSVTNDGNNSNSNYLQGEFFLLDPTTTQVFKKFPTS
jgi:hypothetical protein